MELLSIPPFGGAHRGAFSTSFIIQENADKVLTLTSQAPTICCDHGGLQCFAVEKRC
jgi:hypothetical protein